jgi:acyl-CoA thioesterase I
MVCAPLNPTRKAGKAFTKPAGVFACAFLWIAASLATGCNLNRASGSVAFMGDSLTEGWSLPRVNLGIHGQTTGQMLERFSRQVPGHGYKSVIILGGTNDVLLKISPDITIANLSKMIDLAKNAGIEPTICEIPPIFRTDRDYMTQIEDLNRRITALAAERKVKLVNYFDAIDHHPGYSSDGVHMKRRGYLAMERALLQVESPF